METPEENKIDEEIEWWADSDFINELDSYQNDWESGKIKGYTLEEVNTSIDKLRLNRQAEEQSMLKITARDTSAIALFQFDSKRFFLLGLIKSNCPFSNNCSNASHPHSIL